MSDLVKNLRNPDWVKNWFDQAGFQAADRIEELQAQRDELVRHLKMARLWLDVDGRFDLQGIDAAISKAKETQQ